MTRTIASLAFLAVATITVPASAQVLYYDHHSTALGDWYGGAAEVLHGQAAYVKAEAEAAETWVRAAVAYDDLQYQRAQHNIQIKQLRLDYQQQRREDKLARQAATLAAQEAQAVRLHKTAQTGAVNWPSALLRPEFATSMSMIESVLRNWNLDDPNGDAYRRALATEAGVLRQRVANNRNIPYNSRLQAVVTLKRLQLLAGVMNAAGNGAELASVR